jgi:flagellar biosynthetic protein FlhB
MAEEQDQDKTEDPTPQKRKEAREEGNVAKSADLSAAAVLVATLILFWLLGNTLWGRLTAIASRVLGEELGRVRPDKAELWRIASEAMRDLTVGLLPLMGGLVVVGVLATVAQIGLLLAPKKLEPKLKTLDPIQGTKKLFFSSKTYVGFAMNVTKLILVAAVAYWAVQIQMGPILALADVAVVSLPAAGGMNVFRVALKVALVLMILSILDFAYQKWKHEQDLRMTRQQVKDEMKRMEGDPHMKQRRKQIALQRGMQRVAQDVPTADVVVTNPTHFAIALKYDEEKMGAPRVVAKGADLLALRIRDIASQNGVAIVERPPLARALYRTVEVGREIPEDFYSAVAEILAYVYKLDRELAQTSAGVA